MLDRTLAYHEATKHHFDRYAEALGYLDWATQPSPFRRYAGAEVIALPRHVPAAAVAYDRLYDGAGVPSQPLTLASLADFLRHALALSAWKQFQTSRWALRVNPSSGNLHPTEAYLVLQATDACGDGGVFHYAPEVHALERRARVEDRLAAGLLTGLPAGAFLLALTSVVWREAWKYGERAFRYCQHDAGHALAALRLSAALQGWRLSLVPSWSSAAVATLLGVDRTHEFAAAEHEDAELLAVVAPVAAPAAKIAAPDPAALALWQRSAFAGEPNQLSREHHPWPILGDVAGATTMPEGCAADDWVPAPSLPLPDREPTRQARTIVQQRRSAVAMDGKTTLPLQELVRMLQRTMPGQAPFDAWPWRPEVHLCLFVHRVEGLTPGLYLLARDAAALPHLRASLRPRFLWQRPEGVPAALPLFCLWPGDCRDSARTVSCHQDIAADGFFSLGMLARFASALRERGSWFYRPLFWETGMIGQVLYLEAEAASARATGIGCFFDDAMHEVLGLTDAEYQSLYHFTVGAPVEDTRLSTEPGYAESP